MTGFEPTAHKATDDGFIKKAIKNQCRPRVNRARRRYKNGHMLPNCQKSKSFKIHLRNKGVQQTLKKENTMISEVRANTTVKPGGFVEVHSNDLPEGATVEVIVRVQAPASEGKKTEEIKSEENKPQGLMRFFGAAKGSFSSVAEVDAYIRQERDSWDS